MPASIAELEAERLELVERLGDETLSNEDMETAIARSNEVTRDIGDYKERVRKAQEARSMLSSAAGSVTGSAPGAVDADLPMGHMTARQATERISQSDSFRRFLAAGGHGTAGIELDTEATRALFQRALGVNGVSLEQRTLLGTSGVVQTVPMPGIESPINRPLRVADLFDRQTTEAGALSYVRDTSTTPQGVAAATNPGSAKPEAAYTFQVVSVAFSKIAEILPVVMEALEDNKQLEGYLTGRMTYALAYAVDDQLLNGNGSAPNLTGLLNVANVPTNGAGASFPTSIRNAKTQAQLNNNLDGDLSVVINPTDWDTVETTLASTSGVYLSGTSAFSGVGPRIWGMPVVVSNAIAEDTTIVGNFKDATIWDRMEATVSISDSNQDYFEKNILTLRAELRLALAVPRPKAFVIQTLEA